MKPNLISRREWRGVLAFALIVTLLTLLPYLVGWASGGAGWHFNGFTFGAEDGNAYLGKMRIGAEGNWSFYLFYSPEQTDSAFGLYLPYILIGQAVGLFLSPDDPQLADALAVAFQVWRMLACFLLIIAMYRFIAAFVRPPSTRWLALLIATLGGGLGWLLVLFGQAEFLGTPPADFFIPEGFSFLVLYGLPHIAFSRAALLLGFLLLLTALHRRSPRYAIYAGLCWNIIGLMVTFYLAVLYALLGAWGVASWLKMRRFPRDFALSGGIAAALTLPLFLYNVWLFTGNEAFAQWSAQNLLPSPHPVQYLLAYALIGFFACIGVGWAWRKAAQPAYALLVAWVVIVPVLVYLPINVQRRLAEGVILPLAILAAVGLKLSSLYLWRHAHSLRRRYRQTRRAFLLTILPGTLLLWLATTLVLLAPQAPLYRAQAEIEAMDWLATHADSGAVVMGSFDTGNYLPARTDLRPFLGHGPETIYSDEKKRLVTAYYRGELDAEARQALYQTYRIRYVMYGALEQAIGDAPLTWGDELRIIYQTDSYIIFEVV